MGGTRLTPEDLLQMQRTADQLFRGDYRRSVPGAHPFRIATQAVARGGDVRVGLEDGLQAGKGELTRPNAVQAR